eukprot:gene31246-41636_t
MQQPKKFNFEDLFQKRTWDDFFYRTPCVKTSYLWGISCGSIMMAHKWRLYRKTHDIIFTSSHKFTFKYTNKGGDFHHGLTAGLLTFALVSGFNFLKCAHDVNSRYELMQKAYSAQRIKNNSKRIPES